MTLYFASTTSYLNSPVVSRPEPQDYTVAFWTSLAAVGSPAAYRGFFAIYPSSIGLTTDNTGTYFAFGTGATDNNYTANGPIIANKWYHIAMVIKANSASSHLIYGYVNGQLVLTATDTATYSTTTQFTLGNYNTSGAGPLNGSMRDVKLWKRTLLGTEIVDEMNSTVPVHKSGLAAYWPLEDNSYFDASGNGLTLTANGTAPVLQVGNYHESWLGRGMEYIK